MYRKSKNINNGRRPITTKNIGIQMKLKQLTKTFMGKNIGLQDLYRKYLIASSLQWFAWFVTIFSRHN